MAIALDTSTASDPGSVTSPSTFNHTCTGSNLLLLVAIQSQGRDNMAVTYNSVSMTLLTNSGNVFRIFGLLAPATGANTVSISWDGAASVIRAVAASYTGVLQSGLPDATKVTTQTTGTSLTGTITTVADNCWSAAFAVIQGGGSLITASTNVTGRQTIDDIVLYGDSNAAITPAGNFSQTVTWTDTDTDNRMLQVSFAPSPVVGGGDDWPTFQRGGFWSPRFA